MLPTSGDSDELHYFLGYLLHTSSIPHAYVDSQYEAFSKYAVTDCDTNAQTALSLIEMRLARSDLLAGHSAAFDQRTRVLSARVTRALQCAPRRSFLWLMAFGVDVLNGSIDAKAADMLRASYETGPHEGWIELKRNRSAMPLLPVLPDDLRCQVLEEFLSLIRNGFVSDAAATYVTSSPPIQDTLKSAIAGLGPAQLGRFWSEVQDLKTKRKMQAGTGRP